MGIRDLEFVASKLGWLRREAKRVARRNRHTDTNELVSTFCRRMGDLPDQTRFRKTGDFEAYSSRVLSNASIDHARRAKAEAARAEQRALLEKIALVDFPDLPGDEVASVIDQMLLLETGHRALLNLYLRGVPSHQIAELTGSNASTVRGQIARCKAEIRWRVQEAHG